MLKKRAEASHAARSRGLRCLILDSRSEALANDKGYSRQFGRPVLRTSCARRSARSSSMQFGKYGVFQNAAERRIVNPQSPPILDVSKLLELIHKVADAAAG